jgi:hypothetical protein
MASFGMKSSGESSAFEVRDCIPIAPQTGRFLHSATFGFDVKQTDNDLAFGGDDVAASSIRVGQFMAGYSAEYHTGKSATQLTVEAFDNPGNWIGNESREDYEQLRASLEHDQRCPEISVRISASPGNSRAVISYPRSSSAWAVMPPRAVTMNTSPIPTMLSS